MRVGCFFIFSVVFSVVSFAHAEQCHQSLLQILEQTPKAERLPTLDQQLLSLMRSKPSILNGLPDSVANTSDIVENPKFTRKDLRFHASVAFLETLITKQPHGLSTIISKKEFKKLQTKTGLNEDELLLAFGAVAAGYSHPALSEYPVGEAGLLDDGSVVLGVNFELNGMPMNATIHGEQFVVMRAFNYGKRLIKIAMGAEPCGHCRQFMNEIYGAQDLELVVAGLVSGLRLSEFLPRDFGPLHLGLGEKALLSDQRLNVLPIELESKTPPLTILALVAASKSYSPYSGKAAGVVIETADGEVFTGSHIDNVAFNPSIDPLNAAFIDMISHYAQWSPSPETKRGHFSDIYKKITRITLAENRVSQDDEITAPDYGPYIELAMKQLGIKASLQVIPIRLLDE